MNRPLDHDVIKTIIKTLIKHNVLLKIKPFSSVIHSSLTFSEEFFEGATTLGFLLILIVLLLYFRT